MGAAAPVIGSIITSVVVSKAVSVVGEKIGLSESLTSVLGTVAGVYAGGMTYQAATASTAAAATPPPGMDLAAAAAAPSNIPGTPIAPSAPPASNIAGTPLAPHGSPYASPQSAGATRASRGGMLSMPEAPVQPAPRPAPGTDTAGEIIRSETVGGGGAGTEKSWVERLFSPEKTMDLIMAGMQGYGQAGMRKWEIEYPEKIDERDARRWAAAYPGRSTLTGPSFPSEGGG